MKLVSIRLLVQFLSTISHNKFFDYFDKYMKITLIIYLVHGPAMSVMRALSFELIPINTISVIPLSLILIVIIWYISILRVIWLGSLRLLTLSFIRVNNVLVN